MKNKVTNKEIAEHIGKSLDTVYGWKTRQPELLNAVRLGIFCEKNNLDAEKIKKLIELQEFIKDKH